MVLVHDMDIATVVAAAYVDEIQVVYMAEGKM